MKKLILRSNLSPGDIVMMTAAVRDLHAAYPGEYQTDVRTPCPAVWENNPHITPIADGEGEELHLHYPAINQSNQRPYHFIHGYRLDLEAKIGRPIPAGPFRGDIHLSEQERKWMSQVEESEGIGTRFWIVVSGGKHDFTAKWWDPERMQAVIDHFAGRIRFVQVGEAGHHHPTLRGVVDLRGKTTLRQLVRLVHHADGVVCPVTSLMHLAAAVPARSGRPPLRPCVVIAGGREPVQWEAYPGHRFLDTIGSLPCCASGGCWKSRVVPLGDGDAKDKSVCERPIEIRPGVHLPQCLDMVTAKTVIRAVDSYLVQPAPVVKIAPPVEAEKKACSGCTNGTTATNRSWGPNMWAEFHGRAEKYRGDEQAERAWLEQWFRKIPCDHCRAHYVEIVKDLQPVFSTADAFFAWTVEVHNQVNSLLGKPRFSVDEAKTAIQQKTEWNEARKKRSAICMACEHFVAANAATAPRCLRGHEFLNPAIRNPSAVCPDGLWSAFVEPALNLPNDPARRVMFIAGNFTYEAGHKIGDMITMAHAARLMAENDPHDHYILALNPKHPLNFVFDQFIADFNVQVILDDWPTGAPAWHDPEFERRRRERTLNGQPFTTYKELYRRIDGGRRQGLLCGREKGLGRRNIFEYYFFGQPGSPSVCRKGADFGPDSLGFQWNPTAPEFSVFVAPHAHSQGNSVFTMDFWKQVIAVLLEADVAVTVNTPETGRFGTHERLTYSFKPNDLRGLFRQVGEQRLVLCGNTGIGWIAAAHGVPLIAGEPDFFWFMDYRYRECGVRSLVEVFRKPDAKAVAEKAIRFLRAKLSPSTGLIRYYRGWGEPKANPGDLIVEQGAERLVSEIGGVGLSSWNIAWIIGTPWFWHRCEESEKYRWLRDVVAAYYGKRPLIALGVGSNFELGRDHTVMSMETKKACKSIWSKFDVIIVRDEQASAFLSSINVPHHLLVCPSAFAVDGLPDAPMGSTLVVNAPLWNPTLRPAKLPNLEGAALWEYDNGTYSHGDVEKLLQRLASHENIISARVHAAVPMMAHRRCSIVPMDGRHLTAKLAGIPIYPAMSNPEQGMAIREEARSVYAKLLEPFAPQRRLDGTSPTRLPVTASPS